MHYLAVISTFLLAVSHTAVAATIFRVVVGGPDGAVTFNPSSVNATIGDTVRFVFQQKNHTVTQSSLETPCSPLPDGLDSGFIPVAATQTDNFPSADLPIKDLNPKWFYCRQANHCQLGMVFAVNPGSNLAQFQAAAKSSGAATTTGALTTTTAPSTTAPSSDATNTASIPIIPTNGVNHKIIVGGLNIIAFSPSNISAAVGDTITFEFHQKNHTVTASSFDTPCRALSSTSTTGQLGFDSGFNFVDASVTSNFPTFTIAVNDTNPIWAYCRQVNHCGQGMVFAVNAVESGSKNFSAFQALAKQQNGTTIPPTSNAPAAHATSYVPALLAFFTLVLLV
ncbi:hypothetical protein BDN70DRAFT_245576 [Pholiota conissans]|uniref:Cupredoxin n=1 Tax=Pholiota conissans TaxID=109636 RepID=A0A9P6D4V1_9AGAR|nr:hypothetical protein BDN70DRAFT_245576 [Pholiota conissans]